MINCTVSKDLPTGLSYFSGHKEVLACTQEGIILLRFLTLEHVYYVLFKGKKVVGFMEINLAQNEISRLLLDSSMKGKGLGKLIYFTAIDELGWIRSGELMSFEAFAVWNSMYKTKGIFVHSFNILTQEANHVHYDDDLHTILDANGDSYYGSKYAGNTVLVAVKEGKTPLVTKKTYPNVIKLI